MVLCYKSENLAYTLELQKDLLAVPRLFSESNSISLNDEISSRLKFEKTGVLAINWALIRKNLRIKVT